MLTNFKDEMYTEKKAKNNFQVHFYKKDRASQALSLLKNTPNEFSNVYMQIHDKEAKAPRVEESSDDEFEETTFGKKQKHTPLDAFGFETVKKGRRH